MRKHTLNRLALLFVLAMTSHALRAQIPNGYYDNAANKTGNELKVALHNIIKGHHVVSYRGLLNAFPFTDNDGNGNVWDIYSNCIFSYSGNSQCGDYNQEGDCWNREHTWPQSWFNQETTPRSDLFHVYPTDGYVNARRGNLPYGEVNHPTYTSGNGSKLGPCVTSGYNGTVFEPVDDYKGDIARSYFYMSVRYYTEDGSWSTSAMTNKSEILPWAMTMLLRWSDDDPVSQKEIDRNNAVYGYQNNRNPFIDHPEYARMIWDPNYTPAASYAINYASNLSHGSVSGPATASEGSTVAIVATPDPGYMVNSYTVYKTGSPNTTVAVSSNGTFTMPGYAVTVSASFVQNSTLYNIALGSVSHGSISASAQTALSGTTVNLTATASGGYSLYSWYVFKTGDMSTTVSVNGNSFVMPAYDVTVMATFVQGSASGNYVKVTTAPSDWSGEYLMVCENQNVAFNGNVDNNWGRCSSVTITNNNTIVGNATVDAYKVTVSTSGTGYKFVLPSGKYMSWQGEKKFSENTTATTYAISFNNGNVSISYGENVLQYNYNNGDGGLRSYKTNQTPIQLYKKTTTLPTHSIQFNNNGGSGTMGNQTVNEFEATALNANTLTWANHQFDGWNTAVDGSGTYYADGATVRLLADLTLYAQWEPLYTVAIANNIVNGSVTANVNQAIAEQTVTLTATPASGYELDHWTVVDAQNNPVAVTDNQFEMPAANVTVSATFVYVGQPYAQQYYLVTSVDQLVAGRTYLIVNTAAGKALGTTQNNNNRSAASVTISNNVIASIGNTVCELTLGGQSGAWTFFDENWGTNGGFLYAAGGTSNNNYLRTQATLSDEGKWTITFDNNNNATIKTIVSTVARHTIMYNSDSNIFSCYASGQQTVQLYIRSEESNHPQSETITTIFPFDKHTVGSGATLTVTGTATVNDASHLVLEDGAQFVHHNAGVMATVKKTIAAYSGDGGWYTIATPFASYVPAGTMVGNDYDLYAYDEDGDSQGMEWINYKPNGSFSLASGMGYLYAHNPGTTLRMMGTLNSGTYYQTVNLGYANSDATLKGFNLLGNPTAHEITFSKTSNVSNGYYYLENGSTWTYTTSNTVPVGRGFLVKANAGGQSVTLNPQSKGRSDDQGQFLCIAVGDEKAYVKLDEGVSMPLLSLRGQHSSLYLLSERQPYVMLVRDGADALDLCYEPRHNGTQTLSFDLQGLNLDYLHLIDNLTGADVDLLTTPSYTFNARTTDYASRFRLVFDADNVNEQNAETFAFFNGSEWVVSNQGEATLQVIDMMGRMLGNETIIGNATISLNQGSGVYMLRLVTADGVRVQKVVLD